MIYLQLFWAFFQIGLLSFGGGYAALPLISQQVISTYHWISQNTFTDLITISQMTPGPIAVNSSTFVGQYVAHLPGALIATLGCILPSFRFFLYRSLSRRLVYFITFMPFCQPLFSLSAFFTLYFPFLISFCPFCFDPLFF